MLIQIFALKHVLKFLHSRETGGRRGSGPTRIGINSSKSEIIRALNLSIWAEISGQDVFWCFTFRRS